MTVLVVVMIGVMGAGLLTFVSRDLESVVESNRGQRAQEVADAGIDVAKRHLAVGDAVSSSYDGTNSAWYDDSTPKVLTIEGEQVRVSIR